LREGNIGVRLLLASILKLKIEEDGHNAMPLLFDFET
jgi:hypothetical protein